MIVLLLSSHLFSLDPRKNVTQYIYKSWSIADGLPNNTIHCIYQTHDGYLWLGTGEGLARFDGVRFHLFNKNNTPGIKDNRVNVLLETMDNTLWIGTRGGLIRYENNRFHTFTTKDGLKQDVIYALTEHPDHSLWIGCQEKGINVYKNRAFQPPPITGDKDVYDIPDVRAMCFDAQQTLWVGGKNGLFHIHDGKRELIKVKGLPHAFFVKSLLATPSGDVWIGTGSNGLLLYRDNRFTLFANHEGLRSEMINRLLTDRDGNTWIATESGGLSRFRDGKIQTLSEKDGLSNDSVQSIYEDREGNLWVATYSGLNRLMDGKFTTYTEKEGLLDNVTWTIYQDSRKHLWITTNKGLNRYTNRQFTPFREEHGFSSNYPSCTWEDRKGNIWVGTYDNGVNRYTDGKVTQYGKAHGLPVLHIRAVFEDSKGNLWVGTYGGGLCKFENGRFKTMTTKDGLSSDYIFVIAEDHKGRLWLGTDFGGVNVMDGDTITAYTTKDGLCSNTIFSILLDPDGTAWVGSEDNGMTYIKNGKLVPITINNGLKDNVVYQILEDESGFLWLGGNKGISRVLKQNLYDFVNGVTPVVDVTLYSSSDGIKGECNGGFQPAGCRTHDGSLWFPSSSGIVHINPERIRINTVPPPVHIETVLLDNKPATIHSPITVKPGIKKIEIHYTALSLSEPRGIQFKYMLEGFEEQWETPLDRRDRIATYTNISHGDYVFRVTASNNDGIWNTQGASIRLSVLAPFWQRWWFLLAAAVGFALLSYFTISGLKSLFRLIDFWRVKHSIGTYRIVDQIGSGGMANIYKAQGGKGSHKRFFAVKLMKDEFILDTGQRKRFLNEGAVVDKLDHPNIVKVFERGEHQGNLFIVMELLEGRNLAGLIKERGPLPVDLCLDIMRQLADAMRIIHASQTIHRDLKPGNIMIIQKGHTTHFAKILDFGLAKTQTVTRVTETGMVVGTLNYMSPEQLLHSKYSTASDIYSLGVVFYEMLTGERPFKGETPLEILQEIFKGFTLLPKGIPPHLQTLIKDMLAKEPDERPSAETLYKQLLTFS